MWLTVSSKICEHVFLKQDIDETTLKLYNETGFDISRFAVYMTPEERPRIVMAECEILDRLTKCWILFSSPSDAGSIEYTYPTWIEE